MLFLPNLVPTPLRDGHFCSPSLPWVDTWLVLPLAVVVCVALNPGVQTQVLASAFFGLHVDKLISRTQGTAPLPQSPMSHSGDAFW